MGTELIVKAITATVAGFGAVLALLHFLTTRSSHKYQSSKTEMDLLSQGISAYDAEPEYKKFLIDVRKERMSFLVFGIPIPNADLERVMTYYRKAAGKVTTWDIAKAWQYRDRRNEQLSFHLRGSFKKQYILANVYLIFCVVAAGIGFLALQSAAYAEGILLVCVSVLAVVVTIWINQGLFTAARLGKLENTQSLAVEKRSNCDGRE